MSTVSTELGEHLCALTDLVVDQPAKAEVGGKTLAVVRTPDDTVYAIEDQCSHANVSLSEGEVLPGDRIECWLHGAKFCLRTGEPLSPPATAAVYTYPVTVVDDQVYVNAATPSNLPA